MSKCLLLVAAESRATGRGPQNASYLKALYRSLRCLDSVQR